MHARRQICATSPLDRIGYARVSVWRSRNRPDGRSPAPAAAASAGDNNTTSPASTSGSDRYGDELSELAKMGFFDMDANVALLDRYQGRLDRVINYLLDA